MQVRIHHTVDTLYLLCLLVLSICSASFLHQDADYGCNFRMWDISSDKAFSLVTGEIDFKRKMFCYIYAAECIDANSA